MPRAALVLALALALAAPAVAQETSPKEAVTQFIKTWSDFPQSYIPLDWGQVVKLEAGGPYPQAIRHTYRIHNAEAGKLILVDEIFYLDDQGNVMGTTNTTRWPHKRWGAGREKW